MVMVRCASCGTENREDARFCINCGASLYGLEKSRTIEEECFGLPHGGAIIGIIVGAFIIIIGVSLGLGLDFELWGRWFGTGILVIIGLLIIASAIYGLTRRRR